MSRTTLRFHIYIIGKSCQTFLLFVITQCHASPNIFQQELMQPDRETRESDSIAMCW